MPSGLKRYHHEGHDHFITFSCYQRLPFLNDDEVRLTFEQTLEQLRQRHDFYVFAYVLMPEHVHLLLSEPKLQPVETTLRVLKQEASKRLKGGRKQFWQRRYFDFNVFTHPRIREKIDYIHNNPVTRGLVEKPEDWPWSSASHYATGVPGRIEIESQWTWAQRYRSHSS